MSLFMQAIFVLFSNVSAIIQNDVNGVHLNFSGRELKFGCAGSLFQKGFSSMRGLFLL